MDLRNCCATAASLALLATGMALARNGMRGGGTKAGAGSVLNLVGLANLKLWRIKP